MWLVFFHVATVFIAFALTAGVGIAFGIIARSGDVRAIRAASRAAIPLVTAGGVLLALGALFGFGAVLLFGYSLSARWLIITYALVALIFVDGLIIRRPWMVRVRDAALLSPDDAPSAELRTLCANRIIAVGGPISGLLWLSVLAMMTVKP